MREDPPASIRIDKWLRYARFFKSRSLASQQVAGGHVRLNGNRVAKPAQPVAPGDVLTIAQGRQVRVVRVIAAGTRRGPASEAQALYDDLTPQPDPPAATGPRFDGGGRPTGRDRRRMDRFTGDES